MFELAIRLLASGAMLAVGMAVRLPHGDLLAKTGAVLAAYSLLLFLLERRGLRSAQASSLAAGADALALAVAFSAIGRIETFGFLTLAPIAYAANRFRIVASTLAPIAAGSVIAANTAIAANPEPTLLIGVQAAAILALGLMLNAKVDVVVVPEPVLPTRDEDYGAAPEETLELRESYRRLKESFQHMERQAARDRRRLAARECRRHEGRAFIEALVKMLLEQTAADGVCLFEVDPFTNRLSATGWRGAVPQRVVEATMAVGTKKPAKKLAIELHEAIGASNELRHAATILRHKGRIVGALVMTHSTIEKLEESLEIAEELADAVAEILVEAADVANARRRMKEAELLYDVATGLSGAKSTSTLAGRVVAELADSRGLDSAAIWLIEADELVLVAKHGEASRFLESLSFAKGPGFAGWKSIGMPDIGAVDAFVDSRCGPKTAREHNIGSFALVPVRAGEQPYAFLAATTKRIGGIDADAFDALRRTCDELGSRIAQAEGDDLEEGLATAAEIKSAIEAGATGCLVYLEPQRRAHWSEIIGRPGFDLAIREFGRRLKPRLPKGALAVRRSQDDFVVLLRGVSVEFAQSWANEAAALASFVGLRIPGEDRRIPLGMRAKVAALDPQKHVNSAREAQAA